MSSTWRTTPPSDARTILGIDPGLAATGYGVLRLRHGELQTIAFGVLATAARQPMPSRLAELERRMRELLERFQPDVVAVEKLFFNTNTTTAMAVSQARGAILAACGNTVTALRECTPLEVKLAVAGYGRADKRQLQRMVALQLRLKAIPRPDDAADALAVAICGARLLSL